MSNNDNEKVAQHTKENYCTNVEGLLTIPRRLKVQKNLYRLQEG